MSLQTISRQVLKHVVLLIGSDANLLRVLRGVVTRDFPGFFPMEFADVNGAREALADIDCDAVIAYTDVKTLMASSFWQILPESTPMILYSDALEATRPVVARQARVQAILDRSRPRTDVLSSQLRQALAHRCDQIVTGLRATQHALNTDNFIEACEHMTLLQPNSFQLRRDIHQWAMQHLQVDPMSARLAQMVVANLKALEQLGGVEADLLWDGALTCLGMNQLAMAKQFLEDLSQKDGAWRAKALNELGQLALRQNDPGLRRKYVLQLVEHHEAQGDYRGMALALEDFLLTQKPNLELAFKLLKALHQLEETEREAALLVSLLQQAQQHNSLPELFIRLNLIYNNIEGAGHFLRSMPVATQGHDPLWLKLAQYLLQRGEGTAAGIFSNFISVESLTLQQGLMMDLAYRFEATDFGQVASVLFGRLKQNNQNVSLY